MQHQHTSRPTVLPPILVLLVLLVFNSTLCFGDLVYAPDCEGPGCMRTAVPVGWPVPLKDGAFSMELDRFIFHLPSPPERVIRQWGGDVLVVCRDGSAFDFALETNLAGMDEVEMPAKSNFTVADSAEMIFTKTIADPAPVDPNDLWVWRRAIFAKEQTFAPKNTVYRATRVPITLYFWQDKQIDGAFFAYVFSSTHRDRYVRIFAKRISSEDFEKFVASVVLKHN